ncbi:hypothetical protein J6590_044350 [Homalodisca vitripennis]|nr:hypothetical protein J6590_044350 [Homalodisca vitripennis]
MTRLMRSHTRLGCHGLWSRKVTGPDKFDQWPDGLESFVVYDTLRGRDDERDTTARRAQHNCRISWQAETRETLTLPPALSSGLFTNHIAAPFTCENSIFLKQSSVPECYNFALWLKTTSGYD